MLKSIFFRNPEKKSIETDTKLPKGLYSQEGTTQRAVGRKFHFIHFVFKYKFFVPVLWFAGKLLGKHTDKQIPSEDFNKDIRIFNESFEAAKKKWYTLYLKNINNVKKTDEEFIEACDESITGRSLETMKDLVITMVLNDSAYRELLSIWLHESAKRMHQEYKGEAGHLFTNMDAYDIRYFYLYGKVERLDIKTCRIIGLEEAK